MDRSKFKHSTQLRVRNYDVDWQGIVHNANYLLYFEVGRVEYLKLLGMKIDVNTIRNDAKVVLVRNEIDYKSPARFDNVINILTRISSIRNTSFVFEGMIEEHGTQKVIAENIAIHVWLDPKKGEPTTVSDDFRSHVRQYEGENVAIVGPTLFT